MNILFSALIIFIILLTGIAFRFTYQARKDKHPFKGSFAEEFSFAAIPTLLIHIPLYLLTELIFSNVDETRLYQLLINDRSAFVTSKDIFLFTIYNVLALSIAVVLGFVIQKISINKGWHLKFRFLKIYNAWEEYFEGYILDRPDIPGSSSQVKITKLDVLVFHNGISYLYSGILAYYSITKDEKIDRIFLRAVTRRKLETNISGIDDEIKTTEKPYYHMPGDFFIILGDHIENINVTYYDAEDEV